MHVRDRKLPAFYHRVAPPGLVFDIGLTEYSIQFAQVKAKATTVLT
jgi:hypothetical protein